MKNEESLNEELRMRITFVCQILEERVTYILHSSFFILHLSEALAKQFFILNSSLAFPSAAESCFQVELITITV